MLVTRWDGGLFSCYRGCYTITVHVNPDFDPWKRSVMVNHFANVHIFFLWSLKGTDLSGPPYFYLKIFRKNKQKSQKMCKEVNPRLISTKMVMMVNQKPNHWLFPWFGACCFGFRWDPRKWKGFVTWGHRIRGLQTTEPQTTNWTISWMTEPTKTIPNPMNSGNPGFL